MVYSLTSRFELCTYSHNWLQHILYSRSGSVYKFACYCRSAYWWDQNKF